MRLKAFKIENFKSIQNTEIFLDEKLNVLTGANNCGKTTIIEAMALWVECFEKLLSRAKKSVKGRYNAGDYILGPSTNRYFESGDLASIRAPHFEDAFINRNVKKTIRLTATLFSAESKIELKIPISIRSSTKSRYAIKLENESSFKYRTFNALLVNWPNPISEVYASPVASINLEEAFVTGPQLQEQIKKRESGKVFRNRLYKLYHSSSFQKFENDVSYILYDSGTIPKIHFYCTSDINQDKTISFNFKLDSDSVDVEKDIALLGSGSLQIIEILLDVYNFVEEKKDLILVLLDEPDSHIHRDMQRRLLEVLKRSASNSQIVMTTHNEALIRSTRLENLFHIDLSMNLIKCVNSGELSKINKPHFAGLYPSEITPIIQNVSGGFTGLDFICALEADKIVFVEGDSDARLLYCLYRKRIENSEKKIAFWVLGGISRIFDKIAGYQSVFQDIKNGKSLWDKSVLVFDQDLLLDKHRELIQKQLKEQFRLKSFSMNVYTQEAVLLTDPEKLCELLPAVFDFNVSAESFLKTYRRRIVELEKEVKMRYSMDALSSSNKVEAYVGNYLEKMKETLGCNINWREAQLIKEMADYYKSQPIYKLATKDDVEKLINEVLKDLGTGKTYSEADFYLFAQKAGIKTFFGDWNKLVDFIGSDFPKNRGQNV
jgi:AAA15 family ATPase/GTPase